MEAKRVEHSVLWPGLSTNGEGALETYDGELLELTAPSQVTVGKPFEFDITAVNNAVESGNAVLSLRTDAEPLYHWTGYLGPSGAMRANSRAVLTQDATRLIAATGTPSTTHDEVTVPISVSKGVFGLSPKSQMAAAGVVGLGLGALATQMRSKY